MIILIAKFIMNQGTRIVSMNDPEGPDQETCLDLNKILPRFITSNLILVFIHFFFEKLIF